jgi:opacity protein-like surface antigen
MITRKDNMKKTLCMIAASALSLAAYSEVKPYASLSGGLGLLNDSDISGLSGDGITVNEASFDAGYVLEGAFGVAYDTVPVRAEIALSYQGNDLDEIEATDGVVTASIPVDGEQATLAWMINGYYDFVSEASITPYIMAGLGFANVDLEIEGDSADDTVVAGQLGAGVGFALSETATLDLKYKYFLTDDPDLDGVEVEASGHQFQLGVRLQL